MQRSDESISSGFFFCSRKYSMMKNRKFYLYMKAVFEDIIFKGFKV